ncbi:hypothetical protein HMJ29_07925 [Hymenobacter taeanensis]|uniref:Outer membrane beta-barrel protein n=1 Tax=Hymenobacter taeanensis TaxID=2735321 RepID=A0A6M6BII3_9BACT|nr:MULTISPECIES: hypothetical protein [Hymenobacter]QJX46865.1 hypothetical protein HMJ29_07925 [Hymenobacter taeanensis]UOQ80737.1 hypothetical protein MUN83_18270 [Hymenobacter sp. 5414T-23]
MKKLAFSLLPVGLAFNATAQISAGKLLLSGGVNYSTSKSDRQLPSSKEILSYHSYQVTPAVGFFVADNLAVGLTGEHGRDKQSSYEEVQATKRSEYSTTRTFTSIAPFVRYYYMLGEKIGLYGQLEAGYTKSNGEYLATSVANPPYSSTSTSKGGYGAFTPALVYFPIEKLAIQLTVGSVRYAKTKGRTTNEMGTETESGRYSLLSTNFGLSYVNVGLALHLGGS